MCDKRARSFDRARKMKTGTEVGGGVGGREGGQQAALA